MAYTSTLSSRKDFSDRFQPQTTHHSLDHDNFRSQITADKIHPEQTKREDDEIDTIQHACSLPRDLKKPQDKTNEGNGVSARVYYVYRCVKVQLQLASKSICFLMYDLGKETFVTSHFPCKVVQRMMID